MENLRIYLTGRTAIETGPEPIEDMALSDEVDRLVLSFLVLKRHRPVALTEIADARWDHEHPVDWHERLDDSLDRLGSTIDDLAVQGVKLERSNEFVRLRLPSDAWVDMEHAHRSLEHAAVAMKDNDLDRALVMSTTASVIGKRPFLPEVKSEWVSSRRTRHETAFTEGLYLRAECALRSGAADEATRLAKQALGNDRFHEPSLRVLMSSMDASGNRVGALQTYEEFRNSVADALGTAPAAETQALAAEMRSTPTVGIDVLTPREREVATLLGKGLTNRQIAEKLFISVLTAETHVKHILTKLGFSSRTQVAAWAVTRGLIGPANT